MVGRHQGTQGLGRGPGSRRSCGDPQQEGPAGPQASKEGVTENTGGLEVTLQKVGRPRGGSCALTPVGRGEHEALDRAGPSVEHRREALGRGQAQASGYKVTGTPSGVGGPVESRAAGREQRGWGRHPRGRGSAWGQRWELAVRAPVSLLPPTLSHCQGACSRLPPGPSCPRGPRDRCTCVKPTVSRQGRQRET